MGNFIAVPIIVGCNALLGYTLLLEFEKGKSPRVEENLNEKPIQIDKVLGWKQSALPNQWHLDTCEKVM